MTNFIKNAAVIDGTPEGLFTAIHHYYYENLRPTGLYSRESDFQQTIDEEYTYIGTCPKQSQKVLDAIETKLSPASREHIFYALSSREPDRLYNVFCYILLAFKDPGRVDLYEQFDYVLRVHKLSRNVWQESHMIKGFLRFRKTAGGILYADMSPKNDVLLIVCRHFQDRLGNERWVIHDTMRNTAGLFDARECIITEIPPDIKFTDDSSERGYQELWTAFYQTIAIRERVNNKLRVSNGAKYFWKHMTEHKLRFFNE